MNVDWTLPAERPIAWWEKHLPWFVPLVALLVIVAGLEYFWSSANARTRAGAMADEPRRSVAPPATAIEKRASEAPGLGDRAAPQVASAPATEPHAAGGATTATPTRSPAGDSPGAPRDQQAAAPGKSPAAAAVLKSAVREESRLAAPGDPTSAKRETAIADDRTSSASAGRASEGTSAVSRAAAAPGLDRATTSPGETAQSPMPMPGAPPGATSDEPAPEPAPRAGLLIVGQGDGRAPSFDTLTAALAVAKSGDVIELRYNGVREESPIRLSNLKLTIRAGERYSPAVRFRADSGVRSSRDRALITLFGGQLTVIHVDWEVDASAMLVGAPFAFCAVQRAELVRFERSSLTLRDAARGEGFEATGGAFFRIEAPSGAETSANESQIDGRIVELQLQNCIARGEGTFLNVVDGEGVRMGWHNGFLATGRRMLAINAPPQPRQNGSGRDRCAASHRGHAGWIRVARRQRPRGRCRIGRACGGRR